MAGQGTSLIQTRTLNDKLDGTDQCTKLYLKYVSSYTYGQSDIWLRGGGVCYPDRVFFSPPPLSFTERRTTQPVSTAGGSQNARSNRWVAECNAQLLMAVFNQLCDNILPTDTLSVHTRSTLNIHNSSLISEQCPEIPNERETEIDDGTMVHGVKRRLFGRFTFSARRSIRRSNVLGRRI